MQHHISGTELTAWAAIAIVLGCALGLALSAVLGGRAARRAERARTAERWRR